MNTFIPVNEPYIGDKEKELVLNCLNTGWISSEGSYVKEFEIKLSKLVNRKFGIACSSGTAALDIAIASLKLNPGDEVILPSFTIISCASAIIKSGAKPVVVDADPDTWNMNIEQVEASISEKTKAIMAVHIYGLTVDIDRLVEISNKYNLFLIEDAAELIGGKYKGKPCGSFGDISTFSFYPNKHITTGEGGMIFTNNEVLANRCKSYRNLCFNEEERFVHHEIGWNYRMTNLQAALGLGQMERLEDVIKKKKNIGKIYSDLLQDDENVTLPLKKTTYADNIYWVFGICIKNKKFNAKVIMEFLKHKGIGTRPFFFPLHKQPVFQNQNIERKNKCFVAENLYKNGLYLPSGVTLKKESIETVVKNLKLAFKI